MGVEWSRCVNMPLHRASHPLEMQWLRPNTLRSDIHEEAFVKSEQDEHGNSQTSIRHHPPLAERHE